MSKFEKSTPAGLSVCISLAIGLCSISFCATEAWGQPQPKEPQNAAGQKSAAQKAGGDETFDDLQSRAFMLVMNGNYSEAKKLINDELHKEKDKSRQMQLYYFLSAVERMDEDYKSAAEHLKLVYENLPAASKESENLEHCLILKRIGDCFWGTRKAPEALSNYSAALALCSALNSDDLLTAEILESLTGTYLFQKNYVEAEKYGKLLLDVCQKRAASGKLEDLGRLFWARIQMLSILRNSDKTQEREQLTAVFTRDMDQILALRSKLEEENQLPDLEQSKRDFEAAYIQRYHPDTPAEYLWLASEYKLKTLPLINWPAAGNGPAKAAILCIHGLGLENRSFTPFGQKMKELGLSVYALDVRGFGAWQTTQGTEDLQFADTLADISAISGFIRKREGGVPLFLLGESMGGAIALRAAATFPDTFAGVISSVPSAERFQDRHMSMSVAYHLLKGGSNKPFRVGDMVTNQATSNENISERWKKDYKAKMELSPKELIKFAVFMRRTKSECKKIVTPAFLIQGLKDRLVKPEGTFDMFEAIECPDKNLMILGTSEHLIFETPHQQELLTKALNIWIDEHSKPNADLQSNSKVAN